MRTVGRYEVLREIGRGGMATVYLARQADLGRLVALKELESLRAAEPSLAQRFLREARMASSLSHPNVVTVHDYFENGGTPYIAMEYVDHGSLRAHVTRRLSLAQVGGVLEGMLAGLGHAERQGIVHRDLKPENVLVTSEGRIKIADFGIAKASDWVMTSASLTAKGTTMGTPAYMAPEQAMGREVSARTDLYSVGVIAFELLIGRAPFADTETPVGILLRQVNDPIPPVSSIRSDVDAPVSDWILRLLAKEPDDRTPSAVVAWEELEEILHALLGRKWRSDAALPALAAIQPVFAPSGAALDSVAPTPPTRRIPPTARIPRAARIPPTARWMDDATLPPSAPAAMSAHEDRPDPSRRRSWPAIVIAVFVLVGVVAAVAGSLAGNGGPGSPAAGAASEAAAPSVTTPSSTPATTPAAAARPSAAERARAARSARSAAKTYDAAAKALAGRNGDPVQVAALQQVAASYRQAADAADRGDSDGYRSAVASAEADRRALSPAPASGSAPPASVDPSAVEGENADDGGDGGTTAENP